MTVVGIDLGTTNTVVAAARGGRAVALKDGAGRTLLPSVVSFHPKGEVLIGATAKERRLVDAQNTIFSVKRLIGRTWDNEHVQRARQRLPFSMKEGPGKSTLVEARGHAYTLPEISAYVLGRAKEIAEARLGTAVTGCVITVPANFNDLQRAATKVAGRVAGLEVLRILNEPTAAALAYGFGKSGRERIAVYDFGGGTFDVTLLDLSENVFEVLATAGDTFLGGDDIDRLIADRMAEQLLSKHRVDAGSDPQLFERLRSAAEAVKIDLSTQLTTKLSLPEVAHGAFGKALNFDFEMKRSELDSLSEPLIDRTLEVCREALALAAAETKDFDQVLLVGGSTRSPLVRKKVGAFWGRAPQTRLNPDEVVALGAAIQAMALGTTRTASIPAPPLPAAATRKSERPSWTNEVSPRPRLGSIPPDMTLDGARGLRASIPPQLPGTGRGSQPAISAPDTRSSSIPPAGLGTGRRSEPNLLARLDGRNTTSSESLPGSISPETLSGVGPHGRTRTQRGLGEPQGVDVLPAHAFAAPPPLDAPAPESPRIPAVTVRAALPIVEGLDDIDILDLDAPAPRAPSSIPPLQAPVPAPRRAPPPPAPRPPIPAMAAPVTPRVAELSDPTSEPSPFTESRPFDLRMPAEDLDDGLPPMPATFETAQPAKRSFGARRAPVLEAPQMAPPLLVDVTPLALGVEVVGGYCDTLIARNSPVPCERSRAFVTARDEQTVVRVRVSQGQSNRFAENTLLGEVELSGLLAAPRGEVKIEVTFALDESGILSVSARDAETGAATRAQLKLIGLAEAS